jgi:hypothetical protein
MSTREFIQSLVRDFSLQGKVSLFDKDTAKNLDPGKTLTENGVLSGHHLHVRLTPVVQIPWKWVAGKVTEGAVEGSPLPGTPVQIGMDTNDFAVEQTPGPSNGWERLVIRSKKGKHAVLRITWRVVE